MKLSKAKKKDCDNGESSSLASLLKDPILQVFRKAGIVNELEVRNIQIRDEYRQLKKKLKDFEAIEKLAMKYFLSEDSIKTILYRKSKAKPVYRP